MIPTSGNRVAIGETVLPSFQLHFSPFDLHVQGFDLRVVDESAYVVDAVVVPFTAAAAAVATHLFESGDERLADGEMGVFLVQLGASTSVLCPIGRRKQLETFDCPRHILHRGWGNSYRIPTHSETISGFIFNPGDEVSKLGGGVANLGRVP